MAFWPFGLFGHLGHLGIGPFGYLAIWSIEPYGLFEHLPLGLFGHLGLLTIWPFDHLGHLANKNFTQCSAVWNLLSSYAIACFKVVLKICFLKKPTKKRIKSGFTCGQMLDKLQRAVKPEISAVLNGIKLVFNIKHRYEAGF